MRFGVWVSVRISTLAIIMGSSASANEAVWIDVASKQDYALEHLVEAVHIPHTFIARGVSAHFPDKKTAINLYDRDDHRAALAQEALQILGYEQVSNSGNLASLKEHGQATIQSPLMSQTEAAPVTLTTFEPPPQTLAKTPDREH